MAEIIKGNYYKLNPKCRIKVTIGGITRKILLNDASSLPSKFLKENEVFYSPIDNYLEYNGEFNNFKVNGTRDYRDCFILVNDICYADE